MTIANGRRAKHGKIRSHLHLPQPHVWSEAKAFWYDTYY
jgi:hypothetical protein